MHFIGWLWLQAFCSSLRFHVDLFSLPSKTFNALLWRRKPAGRRCHPSFQPFRLSLSCVWYFLPLLPLRACSSSPAIGGCLRSHPPLLCPLTTWHLFRFIPISWQAARISPRGHNAAILTNQWQINQCYLFFPCLCCHWFFFLLLCCLWRLELCSIKLSSLSGTKCNSIRPSARRQTPTLALVSQSFIYEMPPFKRPQRWFLLKLTQELLVMWSLFRWGIVKSFLLSHG